MAREHNTDDTSDPDDLIQPDSVTAGSRRSDSDDGTFGLDDLAEQAVELLLGLLRRANSLAGAVLIFALVACGLGYFLGIAALGGGLRTFWIIVGGFAALWAIGSVLAAMFRLRAVRTGSDMMVDEVRTLIGGDGHSERAVIETVEATEGSENDGLVSMSRQFTSLRSTVRNHQSDFKQLSVALASITTLPGAMALATVIGFGFAGLSVIFALILIF